MASTDLFNSGHVPCHTLVQLAPAHQTPHGFGDSRTASHSHCIGYFPEAERSREPQRVYEHLPSLLRVGGDPVHPVPEKPDHLLRRHLELSKAPDRRIQLPGKKSSLQEREESASTHGNTPPRIPVWFVRILLLGIKGDILELPGSRGAKRTGFGTKKGSIGNTIITPANVGQVARPFIPARMAA